MSKDTEYFTSTTIQEEYDALSQDNKIIVLKNAIGHMQVHNGRSQFLCIAMGMGYENYEGEMSTYTKR